MRMHAGPWVMLLALAGFVLSSCGQQIGIDDDVFPDDDSAADDDTGDDDTGDDDTTAAADPSMVVDPPQLVEFGSICLSTPTTQQVAVVNVGQGPLVISELVCDIPIVSYTPFSGSLGPGAAPLVVDLTATCTQVESIEGPFRIVSNDPTHPVYNVYLIIDCISC